MNPNGNGLGLSICKAIVHSMNGELLVESELNKGTIFTLLLNLTFIQTNKPPKPKLVEPIEN